MRFTINVDTSSYKSTFEGGSFDPALSQEALDPFNAQFGGGGLFNLFTPYDLLPGDGSKYSLFGSCELPDGTPREDYYTALNPCHITHAYPGRGIYTARLVNRDLACGAGATSCPGYVVLSISVPVE